MESYSQSGQDIFVKSLIPINNGTFVDVGCWHPTELNNTLVLENLGWRGVSIDITDMSEEWKSRVTKFVASDALILDYTELFDDNDLPMVIDYLTVDIEGSGNRFLALKKVLESNRDFKIITIEHDSYRGYDTTEKMPQRKILTEKGYILLCADVKLNGNSFEDWWINPNYFTKEIYEKLVSNNVEYTEIIKKI